MLFLPPVGMHGFGLASFNVIAPNNDPTQAGNKLTVCSNGSPHFGETQDSKKKRNRTLGTKQCGVIGSRSFEFQNRAQGVSQLETLRTSKSGHCLKQQTAHGADMFQGTILLDVPPIFTSWLKLRGPGVKTHLLVRSEMCLRYGTRF